MVWFAGRFFSRLFRSTYPPYVLFLSTIFTTIILILSIIYHGGRDTGFVPTIVGYITLVYYLALYIIHRNLHPDELPMISYTEPRDRDGGPMRFYPVTTIPSTFISLWTTPD